MVNAADSVLFYVTLLVSMHAFAHSALAVDGSRSVAGALAIPAISANGHKVTGHACAGRAMHAHEAGACNMHYAYFFPTHHAYCCMPCACYCQLSTSPWTGCGMANMTAAILEFLQVKDAKFVRPRSDDPQDKWLQD